MILATCYGQFSPKWSHGSRPLAFNTSNVLPQYCLAHWPSASIYVLQLDVHCKLKLRNVKSTKVYWWQLLSLLLSSLVFCIYLLVCLFVCFWFGEWRISETRGFVLYLIYREVWLYQFWKFQLVLLMRFKFERYFVNSIIFRVSHKLLYLVFFSVDVERLKIVII